MLTFERRQPQQIQQTRPAHPFDHWDRYWNDPEWMQAQAERLSAESDARVDEMVARLMAEHATERAELLEWLATGEQCEWCVVCAWSRRRLIELDRIERNVLAVAYPAPARRKRRAG